MRATLRSEIVAFLHEHGPALIPEIALAVTARKADVEQLLRGGGFSRVDPPEGRSARGAFWNSSEVVPLRRGGKSRAELMHDVLRDGKWHSRAEIFAAAGAFFMTNNAAAELRSKHGVNVEFGYGPNHLPQYRIARAAAARTPMPSSISGVLSEPTLPSPPRRLTEDTAAGAAA